MYIVSRVVFCFAFLQSQATTSVTSASTPVTVATAQTNLQPVASGPAGTTAVGSGGQSSSVPLQNTPSHQQQQQQQQQPTSSVSTTIKVPVCYSVWFRPKTDGIEKGYHPERASEEELNGANFSFVAPSSEE